MTVQRIILGDQLSVDLAALTDLNPGLDTVLMMEVTSERWPGKSAQDDKWNFCLNAAMIAAEQERP